MTNVAVIGMLNVPICCAFDSATSGVNLTSASTDAVNAENTQLVGFSTI